MSEKPKEVKKKEFITIGGVSLWIIMLDSSIRGVISFIGYTLAKTVWKWWGKKED